MLLAGKSLSPAIKQNPTPRVRLQRVKQPTAGDGDRAGRAEVGQSQGENTDEGGTGGKGDAERRSA